ncbi:hypothetical protein MBSD_n1411 [Mizugakiibacter sediminis]|uniref:Uncharacterized protein n=1 Tax=Mizugakiibacter sediminis TaxID=1475481 RepID=A0A0K8QMJ8_9GAMM|nr:hypothetical protein [Mizugakiibacter sediminis]GAP66109.1 hypothetical protein MBSD_n1411 [Mizugakiibacter sediminis]
MLKIMARYGVLGAVCLAGCATQSPITSIGNDLYMVAGRNATIFGSEGEKIAELMGKANAFCAQRGGTAELAQASGNEAKAGTAVVGHGPNGFIGAHPATTASATITFRCVNTSK